MPRPPRIALLATAAALVAGMSGSALGADYIYWSADDPMGGGAASSIGRANLDGSGAASTVVADAGRLVGLAASGTHVYWTRNDAGSSSAVLGRAALDGSSANSSFATIGAGATVETGLGITSSQAFFIMGNSRNIGRIDLDGGNLNPSAITFPGQRTPNLSLALAGSSLYWLSGSGPADIGASSLDGSGATESRVQGGTGAGTAAGQTVAATSSHVYWSNRNGNAIGRANLDGTGVDPTFISGGGIANPVALAVTPTHIYWTNHGTRTIGRATLAGGDINPTFITTGAAVGRVLQTLAISSAAQPVPSPTPAPVPVPTPTPTPTATTTATPTQTTLGSSTRVVVRVQLSSAGRYTFIYERGSGAAATRIPMKRGSRVGARVLRKTTTAANLTTTAAGARVVINSLLPRAQANRWRLRVIRTASDGSQTQSIIRR